MNISLPRELREFVDRQVSAGSHSTSSEYIRSLIRRDEARVRLHDLLVEGLESPNCGVADAAYFEAKRVRLAATAPPAPHE